MSSRQMRRLQDLVDRATGLDASSEEEGGDEMAVPSTMLTKKSADRHHDKKKSKKEREKRKAEREAETGTAVMKAMSTPEAAPPAVGHTTGKPKKPEKGKDKPHEAASSAPSETAAVTSLTADDWEEVDEDENRNDSNSKAPSGKDSAAHKKKNNTRAADEADAAARATAQAEEEKRRKKEKRRELRRQQQRQMQAEEDALLDAVLANQADSHHAAVEGGGGSAGGMNSAPSSPSAVCAPFYHNANNSNEAGASADAESSLQSFVMACDPQQLDTRLERIRMFGADAVEDVGDGRTPHRRADGRVRDTGSVSFFPAHHLHVKFVHSAFATPNRYRWIPYDSLGVYLTAEEGHGAQGQTWCNYTLNCDSNAFQRALAELEACQARMGGVQDLIECLAHNKVYHVPTLLQCVYAMEATGESAFADELLDVALYQVGVILRRFALSGTWAQRRLPMACGGNALIFHVLQRGVHAALKRGCLRTAFERTRCLLSLDPRDPCGMLLLLDYTALRAKRWVWLLELRRRVLSSTDASQDSSLVRSLTALPNYAFSWALAKHFMEREERLESSEGRPSKVLRSMSEAQREALAATPAAEALLSHALTHFPHAAVRLVSALGGVDVVCNGGGGGSTNSSDLPPVTDVSVWYRDIVAKVEDETSSMAAQQSWLADLFVARHEELWKLNECVSLLRTAVLTLVHAPSKKTADGDNSSEGSAAAPATPLTHNSPLLEDPYAYLDLTQEAVMGVSVAPIPADLLRPDAADFPVALDGVEGGEPGILDAAMVEQLLRMLRQHRENGAPDEATQQYLAQLEEELGEQVRVGRQGGGGDSGNAESDASELDWYDYDDEEAESVEAQEWYSVVSGEDRSSDEGESARERQARDDPL